MPHSTTNQIDRRHFLEWGAAAGAALATTTAVRGDESAKKVSANDKIVVGIMGVNGRGSGLAQGFLANPGAEIGYVCDVDERAVAKALAAIESKQSRKPQGVGDFRRMLDDKSLDAIVVATPNHWHAPATILGCSAGKHVYVEKPCSHNPREGELAVAAARKNNRVVTMGSQRRTWPAVVEAIEKVRGGEIGRVLYARSWYTNRRESIGHRQPEPPPSWLDFTLWQGPAPERPYKSNIVHYNWHWHWHWGNGELGNNGVHGLDVARWGLGVDFPTRVTSGGGKYRHDDDQETPDTHLVTYDFGEKTIGWEGLSWSSYGSGGTGFGISFHGDKGTLVIQNSDYKIFDTQNKEIAANTSRGGDADHIANFLDCIRSGARPNADIEEAHKSTLLCHLGNIAYRVGRALNLDAKNGHILGDEQAAAMWTREYRPGWEPKV